MAGPLKNSRHEKFAVLVAGGSTKTDAYKTVFPGSRKWKGDSVHVKACELAGKLAGRITELQAKVADAVVIEKAEALTILAEVLRMAPKDVKSSSRFAQEMTIDPVSGKVTIKLPSKIAAFAELAKVLSWYAPEKTEIAVSHLRDDDLLARILARKAKAGQATR